MITIDESTLHTAYAEFCRSTFEEAWQKSLKAQQNRLEEDEAPTFESLVKLALLTLFEAMGLANAADLVEQFQRFIRTPTHSQRQASWSGLLTDTAREYVWQWDELYRKPENHWVLVERLKPRQSEIDERMEAITGLNLTGLMLEGAESYVKSQARLEENDRKLKRNHPDFQARMPEAIRIGGMQRAKWRYQYELGQTASFLENRINDEHVRWTAMAKELMAPFSQVRFVLDLLSDQVDNGGFYSEQLQRAVAQLYEIEGLLANLNVPYEAAYENLKRLPLVDWEAVAAKAIAEYQQDLLDKSHRRSQKRQKAA